MKTKHLLSAGLFALLTATVHADTFGSGGNAFSIDFVTIGNAGNFPPDGGLIGSRLGDVAYTYRMGVYEISNGQLDLAVAEGLTNVGIASGTANQPRALISWFEAATFVNWLNTSTGHHAAYDLNYDVVWTMNLWDSGEGWQEDNYGENRYRHQEAFYFLPSENEWYKAAFHANDGPTGNYWDYATGSDEAPLAVASGTAAGTAVYDNAGADYAPVTQAGGPSAYGTVGQSGNVWEWNEARKESQYGGSPTTDSRPIRGGSLYDTDFIRADWYILTGPAEGFPATGFRVASVVPEPASAALLGLGTLLLAARRRRGAQGFSLCPG